MPDMGDKVCLNHTSVQAVSRCTTCFKPICQQCIVQDNQDDFCSQICLEKHKRTSENIELLKSRKSSGVVGKLIKLVIVVGLIYAAWTYRDKIQEMFDKGKKEISK